MPTDADENDAPVKVIVAGEYCAPSGAELSPTAKTYPTPFADGTRFNAPVPIARSAITKLFAEPAVAAATPDANVRSLLPSWIRPFVSVSAEFIVTGVPKTQPIAAAVRFMV